NFKQVMVPIRDTAFLHSGFQFRFVNKASIGINDDVWNIDYIRINTGRNQFDTAVNDVAYTLTPASILKDYTSMPYRQYLAAASAERATNFNTNIRNNFSTTQNIARFGYEANQAGSGTSLGSGADVNRSVGAYANSDVTFGTYSTTPSAGTYEKVVFENKYYLESPAADAYKGNDTVVGQQVFDNYLAYDDGSAEMSYYLNLFPTLPGKIAIEHHLNQPDTLRGLAIYFGRQVPMATFKYFSIVVYKNIAYGSSSSDNIIYQIENQQPGYVDTVNHFWIYAFDRPVPMPSGTFYIGTTQPALSGSDSLYIGLDRNRTASNHAYYNVLNVWSPSLVSGALMMRPLLGQAVKSTHVVAVSSMEQQPALYPNPAHDILKITYPGSVNALSFSIKNILGINVTNGTIFADDPHIDVQALPAGTYTIEFQAEDRQYPAQKFIKQ
ncbi:MAG TPA: T9SS type A sorting domain-containing protein, partial [Chitinophagaceae bacterium]|nr:T9SS type A sorting domain-containing protein [Chitinophagaceae bacterium]